MNDKDREKKFENEVSGKEAEKPGKTPRRRANKQAERIKELERMLEEAEDKILRVRAEYDNYRKRSFRELADARAFAKADALSPILNVFDHFKMAVTAAEGTDDMNVIHEGLKMINAEFAKAMEDLGLEEVNALGEMFDPNLHEAVAKEPSDQEEGTVIKQWRCGYKMGERLLRPASVVVSSGPEAEKTVEPME